MRKFQPLKGTITAGGSAAIDVAESQINALLGQVSQNYDLNVNTALDEVLGENSLEFGVSKSFLEDRLIISGSFGIENRADFNAQEQENGYKAGFIGDIFVEYLINQSGTFRATAFNQSNSNTLNENAGAFTQELVFHIMRTSIMQRILSFYNTFLIFSGRRIKKDIQLRVKRNKQE